MTFSAVTRKFRTSLRQAQRYSMRFSGADHFRQPNNVKWNTQLASYNVSGPAWPYGERRFAARNTLNHFIQGAISAITDDNVNASSYRCGSLMSGGTGTGGRGGFGNDSATCKHFDHLANVVGPATCAPGHRIKDDCGLLFGHHAHRCFGNL